MNGKIFVFVCVPISDSEQLHHFVQIWFE